MPRFDLFLFDLDDTLVDTWNQMVRPAAREACAAMIAAGLDAELETAVRVRETLFQADPRGNLYQRLVDAFGVRPGAPNPTAIREAGIQAFFHREVEPHIQLMRGARDLLLELGRDSALHLVTSGSPATQRRKVEILALDPLFEAVHLVPLGGRKGERFAAILEASGVRPERALAVGDRPDKEIRDAKALGLKTCRMRHGEFAHLEPANAEERADWEIERIEDLRAILING